MCGQAILTLAVAVFALSATPVIAQTGPSGATPAAEAPESADSGVTTYSEDFFQNFPNARTALDLVERIPAASSILGNDFGGNGNRRGFSTNDDRVLINGKRISGKSNDSRTALQRITVESVARIEIIRGSSPDIKVSSQESMLNVVLKEDSRGPSGSFEARAEKNRSVWGLGGSLSYNGRVGDLDYFLSATVDPDRSKTTRIEQFFDGDGDLTGRLDEVIQTRDPELILASNLAYSFDGDTTLRLNGRFAREIDRRNNRGDVFGAGPGGLLEFEGNSERRSRNEEDEFEIGGDFETMLSPTLTYKLLGLYSSRVNDSSRREDFLIENGMVEDDVLSLLDTKSTEAIGRTSAVWSYAGPDSIEFGTEVAVNEIRSDFQFFLHENGQLVEQIVDTAVTNVREFRNESFVIHSWKITPSLSLESQLFTEYSKLSQTGSGIDRSRNFFFLRPSFDARWDIGERDQLQLSLRRDISQLNFFDFASRSSDDDELVGGNTELSPQKTWIVEVTAERQLANSRGRIRINNEFQRIRDLITNIEVAPGINGVGNATEGWFNEVTLEGSVRLDIVSESDFLFEPRLNLRLGTMVDPITGRRLRIENRGRFIMAADVRHDLTNLGLSYGVELDHFRDWFNRDLDEVLRNKGRTLITLFFEKTLFAGLTARFEANNLTNADSGRERTLFLGTRRSDSILFNELREEHGGRRYVFVLRGNF